MSQPRRRRRRRRRSGGSGEQPQRQQQAAQQRAAEGRTEQSSSGRRSRRRRGRGSASPKLSEDLVRALPKERPESLTAPPDGTTLDEVIGDLQSQWGVPQYPQEYRITIKVGSDGGGEGRADNGDTAPRPAAKRAPNGNNGPKREKAPAPAALGREPAEGGGQPRRRRRGRRRKRGGGGGSGGG